MNNATQDASCRVVFESSIADWTNVNSSFDKGILRIAYHGENRNKMFISKDAFNYAVKSLFNCPVVCNYIRETDSVGAHDIDIISKDGELRMVNITTPVGVVPESASVWWEEIAEEDGEEHEYLCTDILIWKRQEAYEHLKENGITSESMEIRIIDGRKGQDGLYYVDRFEFLAFCLLESAPPCFESSGIELFDLNDFKAKYAQMMEDAKREFPTVMTASADDIYNQSFLKGGKCELDVSELMTKYGLSAEDISFDIADVPIEEIERRFAEIKDFKEKSAAFDDGEEVQEEEQAGDPQEGEATEGDNHEPEEHQNDDDDDDAPRRVSQNYSLTANQFWHELDDAISTVIYNDPCWGYMCKYVLMDYDYNLHEIYVFDIEDSCIYGMPYSMNGDHVAVDFEQRRRKKTCYVDFDEGESAYALGEFIPKLREKFTELNNELKTLQNFKAEVDRQKRLDEVNALFARFSDLAGNADFEKLQENCSDMTTSQIEEKCFAIRGRSMPAKFAMDDSTKPIRLPIDAQTRKDTDEPYGGIFTKYGIGKRK